MLFFACGGNAFFNSSGPIRIVDFHEKQFSNEVFSPSTDSSLPPVSIVRHGTPKDRRHNGFERIASAQDSLHGDLNDFRIRPAWQAHRKEKHRNAHLESAT